MSTRRASDEGWLKYLLNTGLLSVDQLQALKGGSNQLDLTDAISRSAGSFDTDTWVNRALQQDRFHYIPLTDLMMGEIETLHTMQPLLLAKCINEYLVPLGYSNQIFYIGTVRYDAEFEELFELIKLVPSGITVCQIPLSPIQFTEIFPRVKALIQR